MLCTPAFLLLLLPTLIRHLSYVTPSQAVFKQIANKSTCRYWHCFLFPLPLLFFFRRMIGRRCRPAVNRTIIRSRNRPLQDLALILAVIPTSTVVIIIICSSSNRSKAARTKGTLPEVLVHRVQEVVQHQALLPAQQQQAWWPLQVLLLLLPLTPSSSKFSNSSKHFSSKFNTVSSSYSSRNSNQSPAKRRHPR